MNDINRILPIKGSFNLRDLGGLVTKDGKQISKNLLIRSDELNNLVPSDLDLLAQINVKTIVDFRTDQERAQSIDKVPTTCQNEFHLNILSANMDALIEAFKNGQTDYKQMMLDIYKDLVLNEQSHIEYTKFFEILQDPDNSAVIYHCTAGKDRTGIATMLILESLNVDWTIIERDYLLSNQFLKKKYKAYIQQNPALSALFLVNSEYINFAKNTIDENYQSVRNYLTSVLKVDLNLMKQIYTV